MEWETLIESGLAHIGKCKDGDIYYKTQIQFNKTESVVIVRLLHVLNEEQTHHDMPKCIEHAEMWQPYGHGEQSRIALIRYALELHDTWIKECKIAMANILKEEEA